MNPEEWNILFAAIRDIGLPAVLLVFVLFGVNRSLRELQEEQAKSRAELIRAIQEMAIAVARLEELLRVMVVESRQERKSKE